MRLWGIIRGVIMAMQYDGPLEPNTIIISIPLSVKEKFRVQYMTLGMTSSQAVDESLNLIRHTIEKYIPAGSPFVIIDEDDNDWDIPIGQFVSVEESQEWQPDNNNTPSKPAIVPT